MAVIAATGAEELRPYIEMGWNSAFDIVQGDGLDEESGE
jgi:hypothetical protein